MALTTNRDVLFSSSFNFTNILLTQDDDDMNEDLVQLDDDEDIPLPPEPEPPQADKTSSSTAANNEDNKAGSDLYEPENPTEEADEDQQVARTSDEAREEASNSNCEPISSPALTPPPPTAAKESGDGDGDEETKPRSTPSPMLKDSRAADRGKGVLELYDDSDWEELEIDKPKEFEKALEKDKPAKASATKDDSTKKNSGDEVEPERSYTPCLDEKSLEEEANTSGGQHTDKSEKRKSGDAKKASEAKKSDKAESEDDAAKRSTGAAMGTELISEDEDLTNENEAKRRSRSCSRSRSRSPSRSRRRNKSGSKSKRSAKRDKENTETFKKVGKRRKDRNYRGDKQQQQKKERSRSRRSQSKTPRSVSRSFSRNRNNRSRSRIAGSRSPHNRSPNRNRSLNRSRSLSKSPRPRGRRDSRSKSFSRSRSNSNGRQRASFRSREYARGFNGRGRERGGGGGGGGGVRYSYRNQQVQGRVGYQSQSQSHYQQQQQYHNHQQQSQQQQGQQYHNQQQQQQQHPNHNLQPFFNRPKRRELPRYDVRNVVSASRHQQKDRYGRDATRSARSRSISFERRKPSRSFSRSSTHSHSRSASPKRFRSFSISPSPPPGVNAIRRRASMSPVERRFNRSPSHPPPGMGAMGGGVSGGRLTPLHRMQRGNSAISLRSRSHTPLRMNGGRNLVGMAGKHTPDYSPRYTPRLSRSRSKSPRKKKKKKADKKKKNKKRPASNSPVGRLRRISRQRDPFDDADDFLGPQLGKKPKKSTGGVSQWSPSPTPSLSGDHMNFMHNSGEIPGEKPSSWTPPLTSPRAPGALHYTEDPRRSFTPVMSKKMKSKRDKSKKKKKPLEKQQRKEKKRKRHTLTPEPMPSKEVFASGNNILVSVSFNKDVTSSSNALSGSAQQQTVVTLPPTRDEFLVGRRTSIDRLTNNSGGKRSKRKRKKLDAKPVAIIDLERSPFHVHQEPADVIVLTDSEDANDNQVSRRERRRNSAVSNADHQSKRENGQREKTPPTDCMATILETSYENLTQTTGPKTPPEPQHLVKFNLPAKKQHNVRNNPLHDDADDIHSADEMETVCSMRSAIDGGESQQQQSQHVNDGLIPAQKIGPNTPPESGPCSPDAYDPFEPTKSPSLSPRSPTPNPTQSLESSSAGIAGAGGVDKIDTQQSKHNSGSSHNDDAMADVSSSTANLSNASNNNTTTQSNTNVINPVDLVMALMNKPSSSSMQQELANKSCDVTSSQYLSSTTMSSTTLTGVTGNEDKPADSSNTITVLSNVLLSSSTVVSSSQHIPVISSPPSTLSSRKLSTMPKGAGSVASSSSGIVNLPAGSGGLRNGSTATGGNTGGASGTGAGGSGGGGGGVGTGGASGLILDESFNMEIESPYSPGSADYEDLFEPPPDANAIGGSRGRTKGSGGGGKTEMFDNLFGSSSPVTQHRSTSRFNNTGGRKQQRANNKNERKSKTKGGFLHI